MDLLEEAFRTLTTLPHRGSATPLEAEAARRLQGLLEARGHTITVRPFKAPRSYGPELFLISLLLALGGLFPSWPLALLGAYGFFSYFSGLGPFWSRLFDRYPSQNLLVQGGQGPKTLVLMAHYDTAKTFYLYHPRLVRSFRLNFLLNAGLGLATPLFALLWPLGARVLGAYFLLQALLLLYREYTAPYVNGANDNASGVAVAIALFEKLLQERPDLSLILALTGAEEVGAKGAEHLVRSGLIPQGALVLNLDNLGRGTLYYATGEGMLGFIPYRGALLERAKTLPEARPVAYRLAYFDARPFARKGYPCLTLIRLEGGVPPNWHWPTDRPEGVDPKALRETLAYALNLVRGL
ncbi:aminopeptidase [Thermus scotoductus]|uniref:Aminopeptidase n=1 Tax=Thermus scotoductus TaxID=37636 RepID=A0A430UNS6_THESC|nr:M28 family peptidase [Thermus scotoductus]RTI07733.1 aminopeptidase [Thermus scotoductus]